MPRCASCNSRVSADDASCPVCGEDIAPPKPSRKSSKGKKSPRPQPAANPNRLIVGGLAGTFVTLMVVLVVMYILNRGPEEAPPPKVVVVRKKVEPPAVAAPEPKPAPPVKPMPPPEEDFTLKNFQDRLLSQGNMRQIGLSVHNFHDTFNLFPPEINAKIPNPAEGMSWMTGLLPFMDQSQVYQAISKEEAWNAPVNQPAIKNVIPGFLHRAGADERDASGYGVANYAGNVHIFGTGKRFGFRDFADGTSNTFIAGTVSAGYKPWADPGNVRDIKDGIKGGSMGFGMPRQDLTIILMADGSVKEISSAISPQVLEGISMPADGKADTTGF